MISTSEFKRQFSNYLAQITGCIDTKGNLVIPIQFDDMREFPEGLAAFEQDEKYGYINTSGQIVIPPLFDEVNSFRNGYATVQEDMMTAGRIAGDVVKAKSQIVLLFLLISLTAAAQTRPAQTLTAQTLPAKTLPAQPPPAQSTAPGRSIAVDVTRIKGPLPASINLCVGAGRANEGLRADWQRQLKIAHDECGFTYIRFHGLLSDDMGVYFEDKDGKPTYNWQYIDELFDYLQSIHMRPFVELGFMPNALASGPQTIFWWRGNVTPPKDDQKWTDLITALVKHWTERYGAAAVAGWYFEVWNEPNLKGGFFTGTQQDYFKLYKETALAIKSVSSSYRVGGPATAGNAWVPEMIDFCGQQKAPIDFISTHDYGVTKGFLDATGDAGTVLSQDKNFIAGHMQESKKEIASSAMPGLELHYTEWSASYTPTDPIHDSYHEAAYILNTVKWASPVVNSMSYWTFTDIFEEAGPRTTPFHGGFGLMNYEDIKKPAYYAFKYLNELGKTELQCADSSAFVCKDSHGDVQALIWNFTIDHPGDSVHDQVFYKRLLPSGALPPVTLKLHGLRPGKYNVAIYKTGYRANDPYSAYVGMGSPAQLTTAQVKTLKQNDVDIPIEQNTVIIDASGNFEKQLPIRQNDVLLVKITRTSK